jgi:hypothetical protein
MITVEEAKRRIELNKQIWARQKKLKRWVSTDYWWADATPDEVSLASVNRKINDLMAALAVGVLPILKESTGADAYEVVNDELKEVELKSSFVSRHLIWKSTDGTLYTGKQNEKNKRCNLKSSHAASYHITKNMVNNRKMITYIVLFADEPGTTLPIVIEARRLTAEQIGDILQRKSGGQKTKMEVKFSEFETSGTRADTDGIGYDIWESQIKEIVPILTKDEETARSIEYAKKKTIAFLSTEQGRHSQTFLDW